MRQMNRVIQAEKYGSGSSKQALPIIDPRIWFFKWIATGQNRVTELMIDTI
jgi:hypothetical protein